MTSHSGSVVTFPRQAGRDAIAAWTACRIHKVHDAFQRHAEAGYDLHLISAGCSIGKFKRSADRERLVVWPDYRDLRLPLAFLKADKPASIQLSNRSHGVEWRFEI